jgi:hypothetical protein
MPQTYAQQLEEVQAAISAVMSGQSYEINTAGGTRKLVRANLRELTDREKTLRTLAAREAGGGGLFFQGVSPL